MLWNLVKGVVVLACEVAGIGVIPTAIYVADVFAKILAADDPQFEIKSAANDWAIKTVTDRVTTAVISAVA